ncbi:MAG: DUF6703 family protein [Ornithinimicrobium sp.]
MPAPNDSASPAPDPGRGTSGHGIRGTIERASTPLLTAMARMPALVPFLIMLAVLLTGAFVGGVIGAVLLLIPIGFLGWLLYLTWPHLRQPERLLRLAVLLLVVGIATTQIIPR